MQWSEGSFFCFVFVVWVSEKTKQNWTKTFCSQSSSSVKEEKKV